MHPGARREKLPHMPKTFVREPRRDNINQEDINRTHGVAHSALAVFRSKSVNLSLHTYLRHYGGHLSHSGASLREAGPELIVLIQIEPYAARIGARALHATVLQWKGVTYVWEPTPNLT